MSLKDQLSNKLPEVSARSRLYVVAADALRADPATATDAIVAAAKADPALLLALVPEKVIQWEADRLKWSVRADMQRAATPENDEARGRATGEHHSRVAPASSAPLPGEGQSERRNQKNLAQSRQPLEGSGGQLIGGSQRCVAALPSPELHGEGQRRFEAQARRARSMQPLEDGGGHVQPETQMIGAAPSSPDVSSGGQLTNDTHHRPAPAVDAIPLPRRSARAMSAIQGIMAKSITFRLQDGRDIMDVQFHELKKIKHGAMKRATAFAREAIVADYLLKNCTYANPDPFERVGAYFPQRLIELAVAEADKKENAHV